MTDQEYKEMIQSIIVPATLSYEESAKRYQPLTEFLQTETPERLYRFRRCDERSISAFDQDQLWFSPGYKMNDDFDSLLHFDKETIKSGLKATLENKKFVVAVQSIGQGAEIPSSIQRNSPPEMLDAFRKAIAQLNQTTLVEALKQFYDFFTSQIDINDSTVQQIIRKTIKFACLHKSDSESHVHGAFEPPRRR